MMLQASLLLNWSKQDLSGSEGRAGLGYKPGFCGYSCLEMYQSNKISALGT